MSYRPKSLIFDVDGTLWDAAETLVYVYNSVIESQPDLTYRVDADDLRGVFGKTLEEIGRIIFKDCEEKRALALIKRVIDLEELYLPEHPPKPYPGFYETMELLQKDYDLYIVSNAEKGYIETFFACTDSSHFFKGHLQAGDTGLEKDGTILELIKRNHVEDPVYIGDTMGDYLSTKKAGLPFVHASYGYGIVPEADYVIRSLHDLVSLFPDKTSGK
ncbi:MAG: HAD family hydrolase [Lachnospiraceae bacterium]